MHPLQAVFKNPLVEHTACPSWFWNGDVEPDELLRQMRLMYDKGIRTLVLHARCGMTIEYLSDVWFDPAGS